MAANGCQIRLRELPGPGWEVRAPTVASLWSQAPFSAAIVATAWRMPLPTLQHLLRRYRTEMLLLQLKAEYPAGS